MVKIYVQTPLKFWFHIKFSREYDYVNEYPYSAKLQNMTCWTESGTQSSHIKGLDKCVWCWVCSVLSKQRGEVVWWGGGVRFTKANCGQESQWSYTDCGPAVTGMFTSWVQIMTCRLFQRQAIIWTSASFFLIEPLGKLWFNFNQHANFLQENAFQNVVRVMTDFYSAVKCK